MPRLASERAVVQKPLLRYATEAGWTYISPEDALLQRGSEASPILQDVFVNKVQALNPGVVDHLKAADLAKRIARVPPSIEGNLQTWEYLRGLKTVFSEAERREHNVRLFDFDCAGTNAFHVTDEFIFNNGTYGIRPDVVFLINGIPVMVIETKSATKIDGMPEALDQIRRYHREGPEFWPLHNCSGSPT